MLVNSVIQVLLIFVKGVVLSRLYCMFHGAEKGHPQVSFFMKLGDHPHVSCPTKEGHGMEWHWPDLNKRVENEESRLYPSKRDGLVSMVT